MARKMGKIMNEFRATTNEFKETWQREVNFEEEAKSFDLNAIESETITHTTSVTIAEPVDLPEAPAIRAVDPETFEHPPSDDHPGTDATVPTDVVNSKENWL
jgi:hypothetical protein